MGPPHTKYLIILSLVILTKVDCFELKGLQFLVNMLSTDFFLDPNSRGSVQVESGDLNNRMVSQGYTNYSFIDFITHRDKHISLPYDIESINNNQRADNKMRPIKVKCVSQQGSNRTLHLINSLKEVITLLTPNGNSTKRSEPGVCSVLLFYTKGCPGSILVAPHFNALSKQYPDLRFGAVDAFQFQSLNTEFGIIGLPTIMLFHQGRPVIKFNDTSTVNNLVKFINRHTDLTTSMNNVYVTSDDFRGPLVVQQTYDTDYCLYLAWSFILLCAGYYFTKSKYYTQIVEMIKRDWRESEEAQHDVQDMNQHLE